MWNGPKLKFKRSRVKLADRLGNAKACSLSKDTNRMFEMYKKEQGEFEAQLMTPDGNALDPAWHVLRSYLGIE